MSILKFSLSISSNFSSQIYCSYCISIRYFLLSEFRISIFIRASLYLMFIPSNYFLRSDVIALRSVFFRSRIVAYCLSLPLDLIYSWFILEYISIQSSISLLIDSLTLWYLDWNMIKILRGNVCLLIVNWEFSFLFL
jgi:hypothetical protein